MGRITILFGVLLIALGLGAFFTAETMSPTALIPAYFGLPLVGLGAMAMKDHLRKHAMHGAAMIGLIGCVVPAYLAITKLLSSGEIERPRAVAVQLIMAVICAIFVALCVRSFIMARRARAQQQQS